MLLPTQVVPFLASDDQLVRVHATRYLLNAHDVGPLTAGQLWQTMNSLGLGNVSMNMVRLVAQLPQDDASTEALLAALTETQGQKLHPWFVECLEEMDFDQLRRHADVILARTDLSPETLAHLRERLALADAPSAAPLWERVTHYYDQDDLDWDGGDYRLRFRLLEAVARFGQESADHAMEIVRSTADEWDERRIFAVDLLARLRHRPALDLVLRAFADSDEDNDPLHEAMQDDIPLIGGVDAVAPIEALLPDLPWGSSLYATEMLARIKHPDAEAALLRLIDNPKLTESRDAIAEALTELCTTDGLPRLRQIVLDGDYDSLDYDLDRDFVACSLMAGPDYDFPELASLREEVVAGEVESTWRLSETLDLDNLRDDLGEDDFRDDDDRDARGPRVVAPIKNTTPKVGRNDPCPCGSGKKYKKCCLNKQG